MSVRIRSLTVQGFRSYGLAAQTLNLPAEVAVVWGPNSKGKTSLAEAFEFLLTGRISRRELMASSQDEFSDALRNAHLGEETEVFVAARIVAADGTACEVKRIVTADFGKRQDCASRLELDGAAATEDDLTRLGIFLSQPPLRAPVLAQHTLAYIFSVRPQDRATYFKTLLEVTDLDQLRNDIAERSEDLVPLDDPLLVKFDTCKGIPVLKDMLEDLERGLPDLATFEGALSDASAALIVSVGEESPETIGDRLAALERILADRRSKTFPVRGFERRQLAGWNAPAEENWTRLQTYIAEREKVDEETRQLATLFAEAIKLSAVGEIAGPTDCPLCATEAALTPERVTLLRQHVEDTRGFKTAESAAKSALSQLSSAASTLASDASAALPRYLKMTVRERREARFTVSRIRQLLDQQAAAFVNPWLAALRPLVRAEAALRRAAQGAAALAEESAKIARLDPDALKAAFVALTGLRDNYAAAIDAYSLAEDALVTALNKVLDAQADTAGWQDFIELVGDPPPLRTALIDRAARATVAKELDVALRQIDRAREQVLDDKFGEYSGLIQKWWEWLRPDEPTFFSAVRPRKGARRTIDFKAGLSPNADRSAPKVRDVIAVFSQSQLHCLGLALFLARAEHEGQAFVILDDPVLSSDEDYRVHFNATVLSALLDVPMQVIILTQDHDTWEEIEIRYRHLGISTAQLIVETPADGTIIENTSDALLAKINRAKSLARGGHPDSRKECGIHLRDAGELFCKEMLVKDRRAKGDASASLTDYNEKTLEWLLPRVEPFLVRDPSHQGKLQAFKDTVNHACHDNAPPGTAAMTHAWGEINFIQKEYLPR